MDTIEEHDEQQHVTSIRTNNNNTPKKSKLVLVAYVGVLLALVALIGTLLVIDSDLIPTKTNWPQRRAEFELMTTFNLSQQTKLILGYSDSKRSSNTTSHAPFYCDYQLFKFVFNKKFASPNVMLTRHLIFAKNCIETYRLRTMRRILAAATNVVPVINSDADQQLFYEQQPEDHQFTPNNDADVVDWIKQKVQKLVSSSESRNQIVNMLREAEQVWGTAINGTLPCVECDFKR